MEVGRKFSQDLTRAPRAFILLKERPVPNSLPTGVNIIAITFKVQRQAFLWLGSSS